ncbi:MAG: alpha/beta hydrolase [Thiohalomonadales bacterium]
MKALFLILEYINPRIAGWWAVRLWLSTRRFPEPLREKQWMESAVISNLTHQYGPIKLYQWHQKQKDAPRVLLIHGWNGRGLQLGYFVNPLLLQGFQVISFDAPGHGRSPGKESNLLHIADVVTAISKSIGPIDTIIGHSFGAMVMARVARDGINIRKAVAISSPMHANYLITGFCTVLGIKEKSKENLHQRIKRRFGENIFNYISANNNVRHLTIPGLIVHDKHDREIPLKHAKELNKLWSGSQLLITENLGHMRILRDQNVVTNIVNFICTD